MHQTKNSELTLLFKEFNSEFFFIRLLMLKRTHFRTYQNDLAQIISMKK